MKIKVRQKGDFRKLDRYLERLLEIIKLGKVDEYGRLGVEALSVYTPLDSGKTAASWSYEIVRSGDKLTLAWNNSNVNDGVNIAIILQLGHGTGTGGWVEGRDYINPAIQPVFDEIADSLWKEVTSA